MRDFFILWLERIVNAVVILGAAAILIGGVVAMFSPQGGILQGLLVWLGGAIYLTVMAGMIYLGLGIYNNTRRTAEAVERLAERG